MKTFIVLSVTIALALAYPTTDSLPGQIREKKSASYGAPGPSLYGQAPGQSLYGPPAQAPCAASHAPAQPAPIAFYLSPAAGHLPSGLHYRSNNENEEQFEMMMTSDNHMQERSYGGYDSAAAAAAGGYAMSPSSGSAIGLFPNANLGGCAIPLLLSCAPSVTSGKLLKTQQAAYSVPAPASNPTAAAPSYNYRSNNEDEAKMNMDDLIMEKNEHMAQWTDMERAGHPDIHGFHQHHHHNQHLITPDTNMNQLHQHHTLPGAFPLSSPTLTPH